MGAQFNDAFNRVDQFISANPQVFSSLNGRQTLEKLYETNKGLFDSLDAAARNDIGYNNIWDYQLQHGESPISNLNRFANAPPMELPRPEHTPLATDELIQQEVAKRQQAELQNRLDQLYSRAQESGTRGINEQFLPIRSRAVAEEAALGRLRSPVSTETLGRIDQQQGLALSQLVGQLAGQKASGQLDVSKTIENLLAGDREGERRARQFGQELDFRRLGLENSIAQSNADRALRERLGLATLNANEPSGFDKNLARAGQAAGVFGNFLNLYNNPAVQNGDSRAKILSLFGGAVI